MQEKIINDMDEIDIDNVEELAELEARLYAQIHHDTIDGEMKQPDNVCEQVNDLNMSNAGTLKHNCETSSINNRNFSSRYWAGNEHVTKNPEESQIQRNQLIRNPFKIPNHVQPTWSIEYQNLQHSKEIENKFQKTPSLLKSNKKSYAGETVYINIGSPLLNHKNKKSKNPNAHRKNAKQLAEKSNLKRNPVVDWIRKKATNNIANEKIFNNFSGDIKQGLFARKEHKLNKAKSIAEKKQKSKRAKRMASATQSTMVPTEIIDLDSENESDNSDVVVIPRDPTPIFTVADSSDDDKDNNSFIIMGQEDNAVDSTDVQMSSTTARFLKPQEITMQSSVAGDGIVKRLENSSRCGSPCSIQSSDDFIAQKDRRRLLAEAVGSGVDEDLLVLTSDVSSLPEVVNTSKIGNDTLFLEKHNSLVSNTNQVQEDNMQLMHSLDLTTADTTETQSKTKDYSIDRVQFNALDISEDDSDTVYAKGANKSTVIRQIDTSSDEVEDISTCNRRTKRLRKHRVSFSSKEFNNNLENSLSSSDNENVLDDNEVLRTTIPYISKGPAVESYKPRKRNHSLSNYFPSLQKQKLSKRRATINCMSDTQFIATLNNLAQGEDGEKNNQNLEDSEESETENTPTAREMAEKILIQHNEEESRDITATEELALPNNILNELDQVFESIDQLDKEKESRVSIADNTVQISDTSSESDREKQYTYKSLPEKNAQLIQYTPKKSERNKSYSKNGSPIYNVFFIRGITEPGGIGWNDEMRRFYNKSWNGEYFMMSRILNGMNPDKKLWKICAEDRIRIKSVKKNIKCTNCFEYGHMRYKCTKTKRLIVCYMCGQSGHREPRCPNTICLNCGNKTNVFIKRCNACLYQNRLRCLICKMPGHSVEYCPDKWRRYHSTTEANVHPITKTNYNPRKYCCFCGARGHISDNCRSASHFTQYPIFCSPIISHQKSYDDVTITTPHNGIPVNLLYKPCEEYKLDLVELTNADKYYGRFLKAVGMDYLLDRQNHLSAMTVDAASPPVDNTKSLGKKYEPNTYLKADKCKKKNKNSVTDAPNQVQEITESVTGDQQSKKKVDQGSDVITIEGKSDNEVELIENGENIHLNAIKDETFMAESSNVNFKLPKNVKTTSVETNQKLLAESTLMLDSDSNYSFSEHFGEDPVSVNTPINSTEPSNGDEITACEETSNSEGESKESLVTSNSMRQPRHMEILPDFIPLTDSHADWNVQNVGNGISSRFIEANSHNEDELDEHGLSLRPPPEVPSEAKIYLSKSHTKYFLSPQGNEFLLKTSESHKLKVRLDLTTIGYVLLIFGLPSNQNEFQKEILLKYRELEDEINDMQRLKSINVPKRTYVLIKFLRENITQLMNNLGNVNHLLNRLQFYESQQSKSSYKLAEKLRRSLNMILVGQAGLLDGTEHLDKLLISLKKLLNDVQDDVVPKELRSEISEHWKFIFSPYRYDNYPKLVDAYNTLIPKNRMNELNIDPVLLGQKVLDTSFSEEQKQKLDQANLAPSTNAIDISTESTNKINSKILKRKQNEVNANVSTSSGDIKLNTIPIKMTKLNSVSSTNASEHTIATVRAENNTSTSNVKTISSSSNICKSATNVPRIAKEKVVTKENFKKEQEKMVTTPLVLKPENSSTLSQAIQTVTDKWKSTCYSLLNQLDTKIPNHRDTSVCDSKLPSTFWSREAMSYIDRCINLLTGNSEIIAKLKRIRTKSTKGQLSYNDYLLVTKIHKAVKTK